MNISFYVFINNLSLSLFFHRNLYQAGNLQIFYTIQRKKKEKKNVEKRQVGKLFNKIYF